MVIRAGIEREKWVRLTTISYDSKTKPFRDLEQKTKRHLANDGVTIPG